MRKWNRRNNERRRKKGEIIKGRIKGKEEGEDADDRNGRHKTYNKILKINLERKDRAEMGEEKEKIKWNAAKPRYEMKEGME